MACNLFVRLTVEPNGERVPVLVYRDTRLPHFHANLYALLQLRMSGRAASTVAQALGAAGLLIDFLEHHKIEIAARMAAGQLFASHELDALRAHLRQNLQRSSGGEGWSAKSVGTLASARRRKAAEVQSEVAGTRLIYVIKYLAWYTDIVLRDLALTPAKAAHLSHVVKRDLDALRMRGVGAPEGSPRRESLTAAQEELMLALTTVGASGNPWKSPFVQKRNSLMVRWLLALGLRRGELLGVALDQMNLQAGTVDIVLRPDDALDPRRNQPNAKTRGRRLDLPKDLMKATLEYVVGRREIKAARRHGFLFIGQGGAPLSLDGVDAVFKDIRRAAGGQLPALRPHVLRYTWNDKYSKFCDQNRVDSMHERRDREYLMGWARDSEAAAIYTKRHIEERARRALLAMSERESRPSTTQETHDVERNSETELADTTR